MEKRIGVNVVQTVMLGYAGEARQVSEKFRSGNLLHFVSLEL